MLGVRLAPASTAAYSRDGEGRGGGVFQVWSPAVKSFLSTCTRCFNHYNSRKCAVMRQTVICGSGGSLIAHLVLVIGSLAAIERDDGDDGAQSIFNHKGAKREKVAIARSGRNGPCRIVKRAGQLKQCARPVSHRHCGPLAGPAIQARIKCRFRPSRLHPPHRGAPSAHHT